MAARVDGKGQSLQLDYGERIMSNKFIDFYNGNSANAYELLGCHKVSDKQYHFAVWAPNAAEVSLIGDFNNWLVRHDKMTLIDGIWQITVEAQSGDCYKYAIVSQSGSILYKADPYATYAEVRPNTASRIYDRDESFAWTDGKWIEKQTKKNVYKSPVNIYEVHAGSWRRHFDGRLYSYRDLAKYLVPYVKKMGYTHVEFMPLAEHPFDGSWGYQVTGFYAPTSRYGTPDDLRYLVNQFHKAGIGVILDWVPAHFCKDAHGLIEFDGTCCYESADEFKKEHKSWGTRIFDYSRYEVQSFLISNALYWLKEFHFDGLRVDAVASMLYLDYDRKDGEWRPNKFGGKENLEAIEFLRKLSCKVFETCPYALFVAEESTAFPKVTHPTYAGGLGFNYKWNMGWMNDTLRYISKDPVYRKYEHGKLTFGLLYAFNENFILPISHDEVVHGKGSMLSKMPGDEWQKFANLRAYYGFMYTHPGKKLLFMGCEFGHDWEWNSEEGLRWFLLEHPMYKGMQNCVRDLNLMYKGNAPLYQIDFDYRGFEWIDHSNANDSVISYMRKGETPGDYLIVVCNFTPVVRHDYRIGVNEFCRYQEIFNSDDVNYWGSGVKNEGFMQAENVPCNDKPNSVRLTLPPLSTIVIKPVR